MKRIISLVLLFTMIWSLSAYAENTNLGISTELLLTMYSGYLTPIGGPYMPLDISENEKSSTSIMKKLTRHCTISINQDSGMVSSFKLVSDEDDGSDERLEELMMCFVGAIMLLNIDITFDDAADYLTRMISNREEININNYHYRFISTQPISTMIGLEVTPAI